MTKDERKALRRVLRMLDAAGGGVLLPMVWTDSGETEQPDIDTAIEWLIRNDPPRKRTQARIAAVKAEAQTPEGRARQARMHGFEWAMQKLRNDITAERKPTP